MSQVPGRRQPGQHTSSQPCAAPPPNAPTHPPNTLHLVKVLSVGALEPLLAPLLSVSQDAVKLAEHGLHLLGAQHAGLGQLHHLAHALQVGHLRVGSAQGVAGVGGGPEFSEDPRPIQGCAPPPPSQLLEGTQACLTTSPTLLTSPSCLLNPQMATPHSLHTCAAPARRPRAPCPPRPSWRARTRLSSASPAPRPRPARLSHGR